MSLPADPRLALALRDRAAKRALLNSLHQQILVANDPITLKQQLAKYVAVAAASDKAVDNKQQAAQELTALLAAISNIMQMQHEMAKSISSNLRA
jgi:hypothetical protein